MSDRARGLLAAGVGFAFFGVYGVAVAGLALGAKLLLTGIREGWKER